MPIPLNRRLLGAKLTPQTATSASTKAALPVPLAIAVLAVPDTLLTPAEVAERPRVRPKALGRWRRRGDGPRFVRLSRSRVRYRVEEVEVFLSSRTLRSTAKG